MSNFNQEATNSSRSGFASPDFSAVVSDDHSLHIVTPNSASSDASSKKEGEEEDGQGQFLDKRVVDESFSEESTFYGFSASHDTLQQDILVDEEPKAGIVGALESAEEIQDVSGKTVQENVDTSMDEYLSAVEVQNPSSESSSDTWDESTVTDEPGRRYPVRERKGRKILTYEKPGKPKIKRLSLNASGEPIIKRFSLLAINNNPQWKK